MIVSNIISQISLSIAFVSSGFAAPCEAELTAADFAESKMFAVFHSEDASVGAWISEDSSVQNSRYMFPVEGVLAGRMLLAYSGKSIALDFHKDTTKPNPHIDEISESMKLSAAFIRCLKVSRVVSDEFNINASHDLETMLSADIRKAFDITVDFGEPL